MPAAVKNGKEFVLYGSKVQGLGGIAELGGVLVVVVQGLSGVLVIHCFRYLSRIERIAGPYLGYLFFTETGDEE